MELTHSFTFLPGESAVDYAPQVKLPNGRSCVPQHYLKYAHTIETVESVLQLISFDDRYPIFVSQEQGLLILQVGVIGPDNYGKPGEHKIVYGRKWRIEPDLPTSELIQTAFLALQKAREHEIRERLTFVSDSRTTTPFNNHHDLPLMAEHQEFFTTTKNEPFGADLESLLATLNYDGAPFSVKTHLQLGFDRHYLQLNVTPNQRAILEEVKQGLCVDLVLENTAANHILHRLMEQLVLISNRYVAEHFTYKGFARFSEQVSVKAIAEVSSSTRSLTLSSLTQHAHATLQYSVDENRRPILPASAYSKQLSDVIQRFEPLLGFKPLFIS